MNYDEIEAQNWSGLKPMGVSPKMYKHRRDNPEPRKPAFVFGGAFHTKTLEPEKFSERYAVFDGRRAGPAWREWQETHPGREALKPPQLADVEAMAQAVLTDRTASPLLAGGRAEEIITWIDPVTGLPCKCRTDYIRPDFLIDLKSTRDPTPRKFQRAAADYGYVAQVAFYHDGATTARLIDGRHRPYIIAPQKSAPYDVVTFQVTAEALETGRMIYRALLRRLAECTDADYWPGMAPELQQLDLPPWAGSFVSDENEEEVFGG